MKYMGGKSSIAGEIVPFIHNYIMLNNINTYIEPFVGGANIIDKVQCKNRFGYDKNKYLIALYKHLQDGGELPEDVSRETYVDAREHFRLNDKYYPDWYIGAVGFLAGFNGRFYDGCYAEPGMCGTTFRDYYQESKKTVRNQIKSLLDVHFDCQDYKEVKASGALIYCDPPYAGTKGYLEVTKHFNHKEFWDTMREWSKNNIVLISEENAPDDFDIIWEKNIQRTIRAQDKSKVAHERLFIHHSINLGEVEYDNFDF